MATNYKYIGKGHKLVEGAEKVTGRSRYTADLRLFGMVYARPVLSPYAHALILNVDKSAAESVPGVLAVLTAQDLPTRHRAMTSRNSTILAKEAVWFQGQPVVIVVAESEVAAQDGAEKVVVDYRPLPPVVDMLAAMQTDSPLVWPNGLPKEESDLTAIHTNQGPAQKESQPKLPNVTAERRYKRGDVAAGFAEADVIVEQTYQISIVHQGYLETNSCLAEPDPLGRGVTLYTSTQGPYIVRDEVARILALPAGQVRVVPMTVGGGFGAKYGIVEPLTAAVALAVQRPVRLTLTRSEDFQSTTPSPAGQIQLKTGVKQDGNLTALEAQIIMDNGIFPFSLAGITAAALGGYYKFPNLAIHYCDVATHKPAIGAYRAPGTPQATFAIESNMDEMAHALGLDPLAFRLQNVSQPGDLTGSNRKWGSIGLKQCLERLQQHPLWQQQQKGPDEGIGIAIGAWPGGFSPAGAICQVDTDGSVTLQLGTIDISGSNSSLVLIAAELLGVAPEQIQFIQGDTRSGPFGPASGGSQVTYSTAGAVQKAAQEARRKLLELASDQFEAAAEDIELVNGHAQVKGVPEKKITIGRLAEIGREKKNGPGPIMGEGQAAPPDSAPGAVAHLVKVKVDRETGRVQPLHYVAIQDVGFALNPTMVEGQIQGGVGQGIGWGLYEAMRYDEQGQLLTASFLDYALPKADMLPTIEAILVENPSPLGSFGTRGVGEPPITAPLAALANAIRDAVGVRLTQLPMTSELVWQTIMGYK